MGRRELGVTTDDTGAWICRVCGCVDDDCANCIRRTGVPCSWVEPGLCSACAFPSSQSGMLAIELQPRAIEWLEALAERGLYGAGVKGVAEGLVNAQLRAVIPMHISLDEPRLKKQRRRKS